MGRIIALTMPAVRNNFSHSDISTSSKCETIGSNSAMRGIIDL